MSDAQPAAWKELAAKLAALGLPFLGGLLGGNIPIVGPLLTMFGGGEAAGRGAAKLIALALGVDPTPEAINAAIESGDTTEVVARLRAVESEAQSRWSAVEGITVSDNQTEALVAKINAESSARIAEDMGKNDTKSSFYRVILMWGASADLLAILFLILYALVMDLFFGGDRLARLEASITVITVNVSLATLVLGWHFTTRASERKAAVSAPAQAAAQAAANAVSNK